MNKNIYNRPLPSKEEVAKADAYCKKKLMSDLVLAGWNKWRKKRVKELTIIPTYQYTTEILDFYANFNGLKVSNHFAYYMVEGKRVSFNYYAKFLEENAEYTEDLDENSSQIYEFAPLLNQKIFFIGRDRDYNEICIDEHYNFYTVSEWGIELWSRRSFYQGLYNLLYRDRNDTNPYFIRYTIDYKERFEDHPKNKEGLPLWTDAPPAMDRDLYGYFSIEL